MTKSTMAGVEADERPPSLVVLLVLLGLRTIAKVVTRPILCLYATALALISSGGSNGSSYRLPGWRPPRHLGWREKNEDDQIGIIKSPVLFTCFVHHVKCDFWFPGDRHDYSKSKH